MLQRFDQRAGGGGNSGFGKFAERRLSKVAHGLADWPNLGRGEQGRNQNTGSRQRHYVAEAFHFRLRLKMGVAGPVRRWGSRILSTWSSGNSLRSRTMSRSVRPVRMLSLATSAASA